MDRYERYRKAAQDLMRHANPHVSIAHDSIVSVLNANDKHELGDGAFVEAQVWVPAAFARVVDVEARS